MKHLKVIYEKPENIIPYVNNNKIHSDEQILRLAACISEFGFDQPIVVDKNNIIIKGHARREAALKLKLKKIPVIIADLNEHQVKAARIADNKVSSTEYNIDSLKFDLGSLKLADFNLALTGILSSELDTLLKDIDLGSELKDPQLNEIIGESLEQPKLPENMYQNTGLNNNTNVYTDKIATPIYEPSGDKPEINDLIDLSKYNSLCEEIEKISLSSEVKKFLLLAASRHIVFNYEKIANYYAHSDKSIQNLFENSALVIIDFNKAVENGFVKLTKQMNENYINNTELESEDDNT